MRVTKYSPFGDNNKITVTGSLILNVDPTQNNQLANKVSVDNLFTNKILKAGDTLTTPPTQTTAPSQDNHSIRKIDVSNRISQADNDPNNLTKSQIDDLLSAKILKSGDTAQGALSYNVNYTADGSLVTKKTIDDFPVPKAGTGTPVITGTVIEYGSTTTPSGYLRLNGTSVSKSDYSDLYKVIGDTFAPPRPGAGIPWQSQCGFNSSTQNDITNWTSTNSLTTAIAGTASFVSKNYMYILGGEDSNGAIDAIQRASFDSDGNLTSTWSNVGTLPVAINQMGYVATKNRYYLIGGFNSSGALSSVYSAPINSDGTLGSFRTETSLPDGRANATCFVIKDKLYAVGGQNTSSFFDTVYQATINNDGTLSSWTTLPNFPVKFDYGKPLLIKDRIYIFNINRDNNNTNIYYATCNSNADIDSWTSASIMPNNIFGSLVVSTDNYVFSIGGYDKNNSKYTNAAYRAPILSDASIGSWTQISNAPVAAGFGQTTIAGNKIYFIGGAYNDSNNGNDSQLDKVYSADFTSGITDYTPYYTDQQNTSSTFYLPNYSSKESANSGLYYYIKT
jgi:N-acetylneuraminic acid mutarotase